MKSLAPAYEPNWARDGVAGLPGSTAATKDESAGATYWTVEGGGGGGLFPDPPESFPPEPPPQLTTVIHAITPQNGATLIFNAADPVKQELRHFQGGRPLLVCAYRIIFPHFEQVARAVSPRRRRERQEIVRIALHQGGG